MNIWIAIADNYWILITIILVWGLGVWAGSRLGKIKVIYLKNPFKGKSSVIVDETVSGADAMRYKREYQINLIMADDKDIDFDALSDFTFRVEDLVESGKIEKLKLLSTNFKVDEDPEDNRQMEVKNSNIIDSTEEIQAEAVLNIDDLEYFFPNEYDKQ